MSFKLLVTASDLDHWADSRDAQQTLPYLVRQLISAKTPRLSRLDFPAGDSIGRRGWDGIVCAEVGNEFVMAGISGWEVSTASDVDRAATKNFEKRSTEPLGLPLSETTFVFLSPRQWGNKRKWEADRCKEGKWLDVRAYDADDLEAWLQAAPAVHLWLSVELNKQPKGCRALLTHWRRWSSATRPPMSPKLVVAERESTVTSIHGWLKNPSHPLLLRGQSQNEAVAFLAAAIQQLPDESRDSVLSRAVVVQDASAWDALTASHSHLVLIANFLCEPAVIAEAIEKQHSVVIPLGTSDPVSPDAVEIPRLSRHRFSELLIEHGVREDRADALAATARRSFQAFRRAVSTVPGVQQPSWARPENADSLLPALLAGRWSDDSEGDKDVLARIAGRDYEVVRAACLRWTHDDDPPIRLTGTTWYLTSEVDAWFLLGRYLTAEYLHRFADVAVEVLGQADPSFDLPDDQQWMAGVIGRRPRHSGFLRRGIANTLACLGARGKDLRTADGCTLDVFARDPVRRVLDGSDWRVWASLPLTLLAEAAPEEFLGAVQKAASDNQPVLRGLFRDQTQGSRATHIDLLWALEIVAWSRDHLAQAAQALARLESIDPGGTWAHRPRHSLTSIFSFRRPQTQASLEARLSAIDLVRRCEPDVAWTLMSSLLPVYRGVSSGSARPRWREWAPSEEMEVSRFEYDKGIRELVNRMLADAGCDGRRWTDLISALANLPGEQYRAVVDALATLVPEQIADNDLGAIADAIRCFVSRHRSHSSAKWALPAQEINRIASLLARFQPQQPHSRYGWLFAPRPALPEGREDDWDSYQATVANRQREAVEALYAKSNLTWLREFVDHVEIPGQLGWAFAQSRFAADVEDQLLRDYIQPGETGAFHFVGMFIHARVQAYGLDWAVRKLDSMAQEWSHAQKATFCSCLPFDAATWKIVETAGHEATTIYWASVDPARVKEGDLESATSRFLRHDRPFAAAMVLINRPTGSKPGIEIVAEVLEAIVRCSETDSEKTQLTGQDIVDLLGYITSSDEVELSRIAAIEFALIPILSSHNYAPVVLHAEMARNPEFFVEAVKLSCRGDDEEPRDFDERDITRARNAADLVYSWRCPPFPGESDAGELDAAALKGWVSKAQELLGSCGRQAIGDYRIGEVLSQSPDGDDGAWPHPAIRDLIEDLQSDSFEQGLMDGKPSGLQLLHARNISEGGAPERRDAQEYERLAEIVGRKWPRTAAMLRRIKDIYLRRATDWDREAELREDFPP